MKFWRCSENHYRKCSNRFVYAYIGTIIVEMIDTAAARQTVVTLCHAVLFKAIKQPEKCHQNRFCKIAETAIQIESKQSQTKKQIKNKTKTKQKTKTKKTKKNILLFTPST